jgi:hypothetical protein
VKNAWPSDTLMPAGPSTLAVEAGLPSTEVGVPAGVDGRVCAGMMTCPYRMPSTMRQDDVLTRLLDVIW